MNNSHLVDALFFIWILLAAINVAATLPGVQLQQNTTYTT